MIVWEHQIEFVSLMQTSSLQAQAKMSDTAYDKVQARCSELGLQGWELVIAPAFVLFTRVGTGGNYLKDGIRSCRQDLGEWLGNDPRVGDRQGCHAAGDRTE